MPRAIRAALIGDEVADFGHEYREALAEAAETLDLIAVLEMLVRWQHETYLRG